MAVNDAHPQQAIALLACGRDAARVWDRAATGRCSAHDRDCPHCQSVAADQRLLAAAITALAEETLEPPPSLVGQVMSAVLAELRPAQYLSLPTQRGQARIDRVAAAGVLRHAVDHMAALCVRSCQIHLTAPADTDDTNALPVGSPTARVRISVTAGFGADLLSVTARVRQIIMAAAQDLLGISVTAVDVKVGGIFQHPAPGHPRTNHRRR